MLFAIFQGIIILSFCTDQSSEFSNAFLAESFARDDLAIAIINILKKNDSASYLHTTNYNYNPLYNYNYNPLYNYDYNAESAGSTSESDVEVASENAGYELLKQAIFGIKVDQFSQIQVAGGMSSEHTFI